MKRDIVALLLLIFIGSFSMKGQENKLTFKPGGFVEFKSYFDDYRSRVSRYDHIYFYPLSPSFANGVDGVDRNKSNSLNFSIVTSRLSLTISGAKLLNGKVSSYFEADFAGSGETYIGMFNLRHAYINMEWERGSLIFGQTDHLTNVKEVVGQTVAFGAGYPYNTLNRNMQIRYTYKLTKDMTFIVAAHMFGGSNSLGPANAQARATIPNLQAQLKVGDPNKVFGGVTFGYKFLKPADIMVGSYDINAFFRANIANGYTLRLWGIYGENLSHLGIIGGYGTGIHSESYNNIDALSAWIDLDTPSFKNFKFGIFGGYQKNLGSKEKLNLFMFDGNYLFGYFKDPKINWFSRISPRITYTISNKLVFGLEYSISHASWAKQIDEYARPKELFNTNHNNRVEFMAKYIF